VLLPGGIDKVLKVLDHILRPVGRGWHGK